MSMINDQVLREMSFKRILKIGIDLQAPYLPPVYQLLYFNILHTLVLNLFSNENKTKNIVKCVFTLIKHIFLNRFLFFPRKTITFT